MRSIGKPNLAAFLLGGLSAFVYGTFLASDSNNKSAELGRLMNAKTVNLFSSNSAQGGEVFLQRLKLICLVSDLLLKTARKVSRLLQKKGNRISRINSEKYRGGIPDGT
jgi:hypothetical protein